MPKNLSGIKCVKCGCCFESKKFDSKNIKRKVGGKTFYPKYISFYQNVSDYIVLSPSDVLCNSCHHEIDRCKAPPQQNEIKDIRLKFIPTQELDFYFEEFNEFEGAGEIMSSRSSSMKGTKRTTSTPQSNSGTPAKVNRPSTNTPSSRVSPEEAVVDGMMVVDKTLIMKNSTNEVDNNLDLDDQSTDVVDNLSQINACEQGSSKTDDSLKISRTCDTLSSSLIEPKTGLSSIINTMVREGTFQNESLIFSISTGADIELKVNREMMHLWHIKHRLGSYSKNPVVIEPSSLILLKELIKFIHTSETPTFNVFCELFENQVTGVVSNFLLGLFIYKSLSKFTKREIKKLGEQISSKTEMPCPAISIISYFINAKNSLNDQFRCAFKYIEENFDFRETLNILDEEETTNFSDSHKFYFYFWLYSKCTSQLNVDILEHTISSLKPFSLEADECFTYINSRTNTSEKIRVHSFILIVRQEVKFEKYLDNVNIIHSNFYKSSFPDESVRLFVQVLYSGGEYFQKINKPSLYSTMIDLAQLFFVSKPLQLFGCYDEPQTASDVRILVELFLKTGSKKYVANLLKHPERYLENTLTKQLLTVQLYTLLIQDELQLKEIQVYDMIKKFAENECCEDEHQYTSTKQRLDKLVGAVRFGVMTAEEFELVVDDSILNNYDKALFSFFIKHPDKFIAYGPKIANFHEISQSNYPKEVS